MVKVKRTRVLPFPLKYWRVGQSHETGYSECVSKCYDNPEDPMYELKCEARCYLESRARAGPEGSILMYRPD